MESSQDLTQNRVVMGGMVEAEPSVSTTPSGKIKSFFPLKHQSVQGESLQKVYCRLQVVLTGNSRELSEIRQGRQVLVSGFLLRRKDRYGDAELVLHANRFKIVT